MKITKFTDLQAWKEAHSLTLFIYLMTKKFPKDEQFGLTSQLRRAVISIESCIAEGFNRYHYKDRLNFYFDARGSLGEVESQSITSKDLGYISSEELDQIVDQATKVGVILGGLIRSTEGLVRK